MLLSLFRYVSIIWLAAPLSAESQLSVVVVDAFGVRLSSFSGQLVGKLKTVHFSDTTTINADPGDYELKVKCSGFVTESISIRLENQPQSAVVCLRVGSLLYKSMPEISIDVKVTAASSSCDTLVLSPVFMKWAPQVVGIVRDGLARLRVSEFGLYTASVTGPQGLCKANVISINSKTLAVVL